MPTRPLSDFLPLVMPHVYGCPRPLAEQYLRLSAIEWCEKTRAWRHIETTTVAGQDEIIAAPDYATIHEIELAEYFYPGATEGRELVALQFSKVDLDQHADTTTQAEPCYVTQVSPNTVALIPFATGTLRLSLFLKPRSGTEYGTNPLDPLQDKYNVVPEHLFIQSAEPIANGAIGRLLSIKEAEWYDPQRAAYFQGRFSESADRCFQGNVTGQQRARPRVKPQFI